MQTFPPELEAYIQAKIDAGLFHSRDEFTLSAVKLYREMEERQSELRSDVQLAIEQSQLGLSTPLDMAEILNELDEEFNDDERT